MVITITVVPRSSQRKIVKENDLYKVYVHESATDGKANRAVIELIAKKFSIAKTFVTIIKGEKGRKKLIEIDETKCRGDI